MKKLLLYLSADTIDFNMDNPTCYDSIYNDFVEGGRGNVGNKFFLSATKSYLEDVDFVNTIYYSCLKKNFFISNKSFDEINSSYRAIVLPQANVFSVSKEAIAHLIGFTEVLKKIKIPVYVTGVGAQAEDYGSIYELFYSIKQVAVEFCNAVYRTGGEFSLRGYFTKELFDLFGFKSAVVTGCPSIFQVGRNFQVNKKKITQDDLRPTINGYANFLKNDVIFSAFEKYGAIYLDQSEFIRILYDDSYFTNEHLDKKNIKVLINKYSINGLKLLSEDKIKLFYDIPVWKDYLIKQGFNFSLGQRIHGNIISIISGIPAMVVAHDSRTKELAEYFEIPNISNIKKYHDVYEIYLEMDYKRFNKNFSSKFDIFNKFLLEHNLRQHDIQAEVNNAIDISKYDFPQSKNLQYMKDVAALLEKSQYKIEEQINGYMKYAVGIPYELKQHLKKKLYKHKYLTELDKKE